MSEPSLVLGTCIASETCQRIFILSEGNPIAHESLKCLVFPTSKASRELPDDRLKGCPFLLLESQPVLGTGARAVSRCPSRGYLLL